VSWRRWSLVGCHARALWPNGASWAYSYYGTLIGNPTPGIQWYNFRPPGVTPNRGMGPPWGAFCQITLTSCLSRFKMTKFVITETLWSSTIFKTIMVSLHRGRFVVVHLCSSFPIDPQNFSWVAIFTKKITIFGDFWSRKATFLKLQRLNFAGGCGLGAPSPRQNFVKTT